MSTMGLLFPNPFRLRFLESGCREPRQSARAFPRKIIAYILKIAGVRKSVDLHCNFVQILRNILITL